MLKFVGNCRAAGLFARIFFVWTVIVIGLAPRTRADDVPSYQYTFTIGSLTPFSSGQVTPDFNQNIEIRFVVHGLLGDATVNIDPNDVQVLQAPVAPQPKEDATSPYDDWTSGPSHLVGLQVNDSGLVDAHFLNEVINPHACLNPDCSAFESPGHWQRDSDYSEYVAQLITGPGVYVPDVTELRDHWFGDYPLGESYRDTVNRDGINAPFADSISVVATPEPNTGFLVGACFLLCAAIAFRRKILAVCEPSQELLKWDSSQARSAAS